MEVNTYVWPSKIHGYGCFSSKPIIAGTIVWKMDGHQPTYLSDYLDHARFINHSENPNTVPDSFGNTIACRNISQGEEITEDYRETVPELLLSGDAFPDKENQ